MTESQKKFAELLDTIDDKVVTILKELKKFNLAPFEIETDEYVETESISRLSSYIGSAVNGVESLILHTASARLRCEILADMDSAYKAAEDKIKSTKKNL